MGVLVAGQADEAHLRLGQQVERGLGHPQPGAQHRDEQRRAVDRHADRRRDRSRDRARHGCSVRGSPRTRAGWQARAAPRGTRRCCWSVAHDVSRDWAIGCSTTMVSTVATLAASRALRWTRLTMTSCRATDLARRRPATTPRCGGSCTACRRRPGRRRGPRGRAGHPQHQDDRQGLGDRHGDPDGRPDHARGRRHATARCARCAPRRCGPTRPIRRAPPVAAVCVYPDLVETAVAGAARHGRCRSPASRRRSRPAGRRWRPSSSTCARRSPPARRDRHGDRPRRVPRRATTGRCSTRSSRSKQACGARAPEGDPRDRRAGHPRQRPTGVVAGAARRRRLHQDLDRQGQRRPRRRRSRW